ncbi:MAG: 6-pyruvoyl trahydropterin synthase family protein [Planctomycetota bacterium]|jgi:6-pyruvoyltetrahydropterin/6-carboxytetrahydropterin synthase
MHAIRIERVFHATHALKLYDGTVEEPHAHDWRAFIHVSAAGLDGMEVVMDFHELERIVDGVLGPLEGCDLNEAPLLAGVNPSAERVAERIFKAIQPRIPGHARLDKVTVTEATGCRASYFEE